MGKTFDPGTLVELPRTSALDVEALGISLITAAKAAPAIPAAAKKSLGRLTVVTGQLSDTIAALLTPKPSHEGPAPHVVDPRLDRALGQLRQWNEGILFLDEPENDRRELARPIHDVFFADGLEYVNFSYKREWSAVKARLTVVDEQGLESNFEQLGGLFFLASIRRLHQQYGTALGITDPSQAVAVEEKLGPYANAVRDEMRRYVEKVVSSVEPDEPETVEMKDLLLKPLAEWDSKPVQSTVVPSPKTAEAPSVDAVLAPLPA